MSKFIIILLVPILSYSQTSSRFTLLSDAETIHPSFAKGLSIKNLRYLDRQQVYKVILANRRTLLFNSSEVWGYQLKDCTIYRREANNFYRVEANGKIIIYSMHSKGYRGRIRTSYYFSKNLSSPFFRLNAFNLHEQYRDNECLLKALQKNDSDQLSGGNLSYQYVLKLTEIINRCENL